MTCAFCSVEQVTAHQKVPSPLPASPAPQGSPLNFPQRMVKSAGAGGGAAAGPGAARRQRTVRAQRRTVDRSGVVGGRRRRRRRSGPVGLPQTGLLVLVPHRSGAQKQPHRLPARLRNLPLHVVRTTTAPRRGEPLKFGLRIRIDSKDRTGRVRNE